MRLLANSEAGVVEGRRPRGKSDVETMASHLRYQRNGHDGGADQLDYRGETARSRSPAGSMLTDPPGRSFAGICWRIDPLAEHGDDEQAVSWSSGPGPYLHQYQQYDLPLQVKAVPVSTTRRPVRTDGRVAVNRALMKVTAPLWLEGCAPETGFRSGGDDEKAARISPLRYSSGTRYPDAGAKAYSAAPVDHGVSSQ